MDKWTTRVKVTDQTQDWDFYDKLFYENKTYVEYV